MRNVKEKVEEWGVAAKESLSTYIRTLHLIWQSGPITVLGMMILTLSLGVLPACDFFVTEHLVNAITASIGDASWLRTVGPWLIGLIVLRIVSTSIDLLREPMRHHVRENIEASVNERIVERAETTPFIECQTAAFQNALARARAISGEQLEEILWWIVDSLQQLISVATLGIVLWRYHPLLTLLPVVSGTASWWSGSRFAADVYNFDVEQTPKRRERDAIEGILTERRAGKEVRLYQAHAIWIEHWQQLWRALINGQRAIERRKFLAHLAIDLMRGGLYVCSLIFLLRVVFQGGLSVGTYIAAAAALISLDGIWNEVASYFQWIGDDMRRLSGDLYPFLDENPDPLAQKPTFSAARQKTPSVVEPQSDFPKTELQPDSSDTKTDIVLENVAFFYPNAQEPALNHITLTFKRGERVALVGPNGAGKTTLARLLLGLYRPDTGVIRVGNVPLAPENHQQWMKQCSAVFQDFTQYHLTARDNIIFGDVERPARMEEAAVAGGAVDVIDRLPEAYDAVLGPTFGGRELSGGEWQRLATARSFMRETPWLVVLDEPTAALDPLAEQAVYEQFSQRSTGRTSVLISHRLSSVRTCDRILVLENGTLVEDGSHEALLAKGGLYAKFFKAQAQGYV